MSNSEAGGSFDVELTEERPGYLTFIARGARAWSLFSPESGGHRWQRVPPTEKRGRMQTSTVTVAVLPLHDESGCSLDLRDVEFSTCRGSGAGGQHRNTTDSAVQAVHIPTGLRVRCEGERSQHANRRTALQILAARLEQGKRDRQATTTNRDRKTQVGSGQRGDKTRTIRTQDDCVTNHVSGKKMKLERYLKGFIDEIH